ncbi:hypothetical protein ACIRYZ_36600 [Kitasatospora sp. NPDC101155]|uniref:hypothetical protein n=1 Tax=Kitasatospora sp. NPDC101155 TaxID=3364097 RepID=UPI0037FCBC7A
MTASMLVAKLKGFLNGVECELPADEAARIALAEHSAGQARALVAAEDVVLPLRVLADLETVARDAAGYRASATERCHYLDRQARLLHDIIDATGDDASRWIAQDAEDRADNARYMAQVDAELNATPPPPARAITPWPHPTTTAMLAARAKARK